MAFVKLKRETARDKTSRKMHAIEFGVGARCGAPNIAIMDCKVRLRPSLLGRAQEFLVVNTWFDISFDPDTRMLLIETGTDFKLARPGGPPSATVAVFLLGFPLPEGIKAQSFCLPVEKFAVGDQSLQFAVPSAAFAPVPVSFQPKAAAAQPASGKAPFVSALASQKHDVRRGS